MVLIVLVNWNGWKDLSETLESLMWLDFDSYGIIVCDNASSDGSREMIQDWASSRRLSHEVNHEIWHTFRHRIWRPAVIYDATAESLPRGGGAIGWVDVGFNAGFAGATNVGLRLALSDPSCEYVWLLNSDTVVDPSSLTFLVERHRSDTTLGMVGSTLLLYSNPNHVQALGVRFNVWTGQGFEIARGTRKENLPSPYQVEELLSYVVGASMLVSRRFLEEVGLMDESYFLYFEEVDWAFRARNRFGLGWARESLVFHKEGGSIGTSGDARGSDTSIYYKSINLLRFAAKNQTGAVIIHLLKLILIAARFLFRRDPRGAVVIMHALKDFISGKRRQGLFKLSSENEKK